MVVKIILLAIVILVILSYDIPKLVQKKRKERIVYGALMLPVFYLSLVYIFELTWWPTLDEFYHFLLLKPAQQIVNSIKLMK